MRMPGPTHPCRGDIGLLEGAGHEDQSALRTRLSNQMEETRQRTLKLAEALLEEDRCRRFPPYYSPFDWHLGHIAMTEAYWTVTRAQGQAAPLPEMEFIFANVPENPRQNRVNLPSRAAIVEYMRCTRIRSLDALARLDFSDPDPLIHDGYAFSFALAHEWQHQETLVEILHLLGSARPLPPLSASIWPPPDARAGGISAGAARQVRIPAGPFQMGSDDPQGYDNEQPAHEVFVPEFDIDETPVTAAQYGAFIADEGYHRREFWDEAGWAWASRAGVSAPQYSGRGPFGDCSPRPESPVCGVNWYEASAYARWIGRRLPTEAEWEKAAAWDPTSGTSRRFPWGNEQAGAVSADHDIRDWGPAPVGSYPAGRSACGALDMAGGVWEWTSSLFAPYHGFEAFPYEGYSEDAFDGRHRTLKGGSWVTRGPLLRSCFRNFYFPDYRQGFIGFRCARSL